jgi:GMP synthase (glutamine-hydrolysing)
VVRILVVEHEPTCPIDRMDGWLRQAAEAAGIDLSLEICRPYAADDVPGHIDGDALIVLGGTRGAEDDDFWPWLPATRQLLAHSTEAGVPVLGICLGAQLLAVATGGKVEPGAAGIEAGVVSARWRPESAHDPLVRGLPDPFPGPSMHRDAVTVLPPGAVWLAETDMYAHQAFRVGERAWGVQFHPEVSRETFQGWADGHERDGDWARWGIDPSAPIGEFVARGDELVAAGRLLTARFAAAITTAKADRGVDQANPS